MTDNYGPQYSGPEYLRRSFEPHLESASSDPGTIYSLPDPNSVSDHFKIENDGSFPSTSGAAPDAFGFGHLIELRQPHETTQPALVQPLVPQQIQPGGDDPNAPPVGQSPWSALMKQMVHGR